MVYSTFSTRDSSRRVGKMLLKEETVACVNFIDGMESCYQWEGKIIEEKEIIMLAKTVKDQFDRVKEIILNNHEYENPCILSIPINNGSKTFLQWIEDIVKIKNSL